MLFTELMHAIRPHLMKDAETPDFVRNVIQMLCDIPEEDWYTKKDPSSDQRYKDASLRQYYSRGISKKLAKSMLAVGVLNKENFIDSINDPNRDDIFLGGLVEAVAPFCIEPDDVDENNVAEILFDLFRKSLEFTVDPTLENDRKIEVALNKARVAKGKFGSGLLDDCHHTCSMPGCANHLQTLTASGESVSNYQIIRIEDSKGSNYNNLLAVCNDCFQSYSLSHKKMDEKSLQTIKKLQSNARLTRTTLDDVAIFRGIELVIQNLSTVKPQQLQELNYDPVTITEKLDKNKHIILVNEIKDNVVRYVTFVESTMRDLAIKNQYSDDLIRAQVKEAYKQLASKKISSEEIYQGISERIQRITKQDIRFCYIVTSYFVHSCEVFHATAK